MWLLAFSTNHQPRVSIRRPFFIVFPKHQFLTSGWLRWRRIWLVCLSCQLKHRQIRLKFMIIPIFHRLENQSSEVMLTVHRHQPEIFFFYFFLHNICPDWPIPLTSYGGRDVVAAWTRWCCCGSPGRRWVNTLGVAPWFRSFLFGRFVASFVRCFWGRMFKQLK